jgi:glycosidase
LCCALCAACGPEYVKIGAPASEAPDSVAPLADLGAPSPDGGPGVDGSVDQVWGDSGVAGGDGAAKDACLVPTRCDVTFSYPRGAEQRVELFGDFNGWSSGVPMTAVSGDWQTVVSGLAHGQQLAYKFVIDGTRWVNDPHNPRRSSDGFDNSLLEVRCPNPCGAPDGGGADSAASGDGAGPAQPFDWRDAVMYFVLLDRFADGDPANNRAEAGVETAANYQGGDLAGLRQKIEDGYFDALGVNVLWLSSPLDAPDGRYPGVDGHDYTGYHGYWPVELDRIEARLGDRALLQQTIRAAHDRGLRVVLDYVMNHVHETSSLWQTHPDWFWPRWFSGRDCVCGQQCSWDAEPDRLRCWFMPYLPDFDFGNPAARQASVQNALQWITDLEIDGYRLDAVKHIDPAWLADLRAGINQLGLPRQFYLVGETFTDDRQLLRAYVDPATKLDGQFDFPLRAALVRTILRREGSLRELESFVAGNVGFYGPSAVMGTFLGNHDLPRAIHLAEDPPQFGAWDSGKARAWYDRPRQPTAAAPYQRLAVAFAALLTLPGLPLIYYGDEVGLAGGGDPDNRRPMPWSGISVPQQQLLQTVGKLVAIRRAHPALSRGTPQQLWLGDDVLAYRMRHGADELVVVLNRSDSDQAIQLPAGSYTDLLRGATFSASLTAPARAALILEPGSAP